jgi:hypothetical protein
MKNVQKLILPLLSAVLLIEGCAVTGKVKRFEECSPAGSEAVSKVNRQCKVPYKKRFIFLMAWNGIPVGSITAEIPRMIEYKGRQAYVVRLVTESNRFLSKIYKVEDTYISYVDAEKIHSLRFEADRKEGRYRKHVIVEYDFDKAKATYTNLTDGSVKTCDINKNVQDPLSAVCFFMTLPVKEGEKLDITVNLNEKNYNVFIQVEQFDIIKLPRVGEFPAYRIRPYAELNGKKYEKGRGWIYVSADNNRYPLYGVIRIPFGKVTATLKSVEEI